MEGVERELRNGLTDRLGSEGTDHLARMHLALDILEPHLPNDFVEDCLGEPVFQDRATRSKVESEEAVEDTVGREPRLFHELGEFVHDICGGQVSLGRVRVGILLNHPLEMDRGDHRILLDVCEHLLYQHVTILHEFVNEVGRLGN